MADTTAQQYLQEHVKPVLTPLLRKACEKRPSDVRAFLLDTLTVSDRAIHMNAWVPIPPGKDGQAGKFFRETFYGDVYVASITKKDGQNIISHRSSISDDGSTGAFEEAYDNHSQVLLHIEEYPVVLGPWMAEFAGLADLAKMTAEISGPKDELEKLVASGNPLCNAHTCRWHLRTSYRLPRPAVAPRSDQTISWRLTLDIHAGEEEAFWRAASDFRHVHQRVMGDAAGTTHFGICEDSEGGSGSGSGDGSGSKSQALVREGYTCEGMEAYWAIKASTPEYESARARVFSELSSISHAEIHGPEESVKQLKAMLAKGGATDGMFAFLKGGLRRLIV